MKNKQILKALLITISLSALSCTNPFAPSLDNKPADSPVLGDQRTIDGVFINFRYAYMFKDTVVYGRLLADEFTFISPDYDKGVDITWGREEDMRTTANLFDAVQTLDLIWNEVVTSAGDSLTIDVSRGFMLTIVFSSIDIIRIYGRASFLLVRQKPEDVWKISRWRDESNY